MTDRSSSPKVLKTMLRRSYTRASSGSAPPSAAATAFSGTIAVRKISPIIRAFRDMTGGNDATDKAEPSSGRKRLTSLDSWSVKSTSDPPDRRTSRDKCRSSRALATSAASGRSATTRDSRTSAVAT